MEIKFSSQGNGACPFCEKQDKCLILKKLRKAVEDMGDSKGTGMEIVIYTCPNFKEKF